MRLVVPRRAALGERLEKVALGMVPRMQAGSVASGVVALTVLLARLVHMLVAAGVWPEMGDRGQEGHHLRSRLSAEMCTKLFLCLGEPLCHGYQWAIP